MKRLTFYLTLFVVLSLPCLRANAQLYFTIDSLAIDCYGDKSVEEGYETMMFKLHGPDVLVHGKLVNDTQQDIVFELVFLDSNKTDLRIDFKLKLSYIYCGEEVEMFMDPLFKGFSFTYPYLDGSGELSYFTTINNKTVSYGIIKANESIPVVFESLSWPFRMNTSDWRLLDVRTAAVSRQRHIAEAIRKTLMITPVIIKHGNTGSLEEQVKLHHEFYLESTETKRNEQYEKYHMDWEEAIPRSLIINNEIGVKPLFLDGGDNGFRLWLEEQIKQEYIFHSGKERDFLIIFGINTEGKVVYSESYPPFYKGDDYDKAIEEIILRSPSWTIGEVKGKQVNVKVNCLFRVREDGSIADFKML